MAWKILYDAGWMVLTSRTGPVECVSLLPVPTLSRLTESCDIGAVKQDWFHCGGGLTPNPPVIVVNLEFEALEVRCSRLVGDLCYYIQ